MYTNSKLAKAVRIALISGVATSAFATSPILAQEETAEEVEKIAVTGSRIKRADLESSSPVFVLDRSQLLTSGLTDVGDFIQSMPSMSGSPIGTTTNNGGNGAVLVDMRGLGVNRTLTLVNGRRVVDGGDYQTIPAAMIERVEILKDGASAVYGADAVAGVVNIITRSNFEGVEVEFQTADFFDMDSGKQDSFSVIAGKDFGEGHFVFGGEYVSQEEAYQSDAPWDFMQNSYYIYPEGCEAQVAAPYDGSATSGCYPIGSSRIPEGRIIVDGNVYMNTGNGLEPYDGRTYNYAPVNFIQTPYEKTNLFAEGSFDVTENTRFFGEIRANLRTSKQELAPMPYDSRFDPAHDGLYDFDGDGVVEPYSGVHQDNYYLTQALAAAGIANQPATEVRRRMLESARTFEQDITQVQAAMGFEGVVFDDYDWQLTYNRGIRSRTDQDFGQFVGSRIQNAFGPSADLDGDGMPECYSDINDANTLIEGCVPFNLFGGAGAATQEMYDYVEATLTDTYTTKHELLDFSISGLGYELPGGQLGWAAGMGYYGQSYEYSPDSGKATDGVTGNTGAGTFGTLYNTNAFVELQAPLYSEGEMSFDVKAGLRYDDYNVFGSDTTWQIGFDFQVIEELKIRSTAGTVFRAPTISDLYGGQVDDFPTYSDPCDISSGGALPAGCDQSYVQQDSQLLARVGGNPFLTPETGDTFTAGLVYSPEIDGHDVTLTLDYWKTDIEDGISSLGVQYILDSCYIEQNPGSCALITRGDDYSIQQVLDTSLNVAEQGASGIDTEVNWQFDTSMGMVNAKFLWAHLLDRTKIPSPGEDEIDLSGRYTDPTAEDGGAYAEDKINASVALSNDGITVSYAIEYISALDADTFCNCGTGNQPDGSYIQTIDSVLYHDLVGSYDFGQGTVVTAGITNLTDEEPPFIEVGFNATTDPSTYRLFGRGYYLRFKHAF